MSIKASDSGIQNDVLFYSLWCFRCLIWDVDLQTGHMYLQHAIPCIVLVGDINYCQPTAQVWLNLCAPMYVTYYFSVDLEHVVLLYMAYVCCSIVLLWGITYSMLFHSASMGHNLQHVVP